MSEPLEITHRSGHLRYVTIVGETYTVSHLSCECAEATISLAPHKHDPKDSISVKIHCPIHGTLSASASKAGLTFACDVPNNPIVFEWSEARHAKDKRVAWGMSKRRTQ